MPSPSRNSLPPDRPRPRPPHARSTAMTPTPDTTPANAERLLKLQAAVVNAPTVDFDMGTWSCAPRGGAAGWSVKMTPACGLEVAPGFVGRISPAGQGEVDTETSPVEFVAEHFGLDTS